MTGKYRGSHLPTIPPTHTTSPDISILLHLSPGTLVTISEPSLTHHNHPKAMVYIRVHSWCLTAHAAVGFVSQSTLCNPVDYSPPGSSVHGDSPGKNAGVGLHALLQEIFPTQGLSPHLSHLQWILYHLSHQGSPLQPISLDKFIVTCIYHYRFKQNSLTAMKPLCSAYSCVPPT